MYLPSPKELKKMRKKAGLTQSELARLAGVSQSMIARIESGTVDPRLSTLKKIVNALSSVIVSGHTVAEVLEKKTNENPKFPRLIFVKPSDSVRRATDLMKNYGVSQIPVLDENLKPIGSITERGLMRAFTIFGKDLLNRKVIDIMNESFPIVNIESKLSEVYSLFIEGNDAILVVKKGKIVGILTKIDILSFLIQ
ncbi:MAG: CBS domain-containing protein [Candidatus Asgardarchaeia archaeon]